MKNILFKISLGILSVLYLCGLSGHRAEAVELYGGPMFPDIVEQAPSHLQIQNEHQREMLRFSTNHINLGQGPLQIRGGGQIAPCTINGVSYDRCTYATQELLDANGRLVLTHPAGVALFHPEHNHWHQSAVANFAVRSGALNGPIVANGEKITFCLIDFDKTTLITSNNTRVYWSCDAELQGISPGWADEYHHSTEGQELDITTIPEGLYYLTNQADPEDHWLESDETNNFAWVKFFLSRKGANPSITILGQSACDGDSCGNGANK